jgi:hypothetical protein
MAIKIYREEKLKTELKTPMIAYEKKGHYFCSSDGDFIAWIIVYHNNRMKPECRELLESSGYRTDFAEWDNEGRLVRFLEEIV